MYLDWIDNPSIPITAHQMQILKLFKNAEVPDSIIQVTEIISPTQFQRPTASIFENLTTRRINFYPEVNQKFDIAIGVYASRMKETFNPLYWIDLILFAPRYLVRYIGFDTEKAAAKICNVLLTFIWWVAMFFLAFFYNQIKLWMIDFLSR